VPSEELAKIEAKWTATGRKVAAYMGDHETFPGEIRDAENFHLIARVLLGESGDDADGRAMADAYADVPALVAEVRGLAAEVGRLSSVAPRWVESKGGGVWSLTVGRAHHIATVERRYGNFRAWTRLAGEVHAMPVAVESDLPTACRAVCARLGLSYIAPPTEGT